MRVGTFVIMRSWVWLYLNGPKYYVFNQTIKTIYLYSMSMSMQGISVWRYLRAWTFVSQREQDGGNDEECFVSIFMEIGRDVIFIKSLSNRFVDIVFCRVLLNTFVSRDFFIQRDQTMTRVVSFFCLRGCAEKLSF